MYICVCVITIYLLFGIVVEQVYDTDVNKEYAIRGNSAILKCQIPSFVADFVSVVSWHTEQGDDFYPGSDFGNNLVTPCHISKECLFFLSIETSLALL